MNPLESYLKDLYEIRSSGGAGTGAYLVEVLHKIHETLKAKGEDALAA